MQVLVQTVLARPAVLLHFAGTTLFAGFALDRTTSFHCSRCSWRNRLRYPDNTPLDIVVSMVFTRRVYRNDELFINFTRANSEAHKLATTRCFCFVQ